MTKEAYAERLAAQFRFHVELNEDKDEKPRLIRLKKLREAWESAQMKIFDAVGKKPLAAMQAQFQMLIAPAFFFPSRIDLAAEEKLQSDKVIAYDNTVMTAYRELLGVDLSEDEATALKDYAIVARSGMAILVEHTATFSGLLEGFDEKEVARGVARGFLRAMRG